MKLLTKELLEKFKTTGSQMESPDPLIVCTHAQTTEAILAAKVISAVDLQRCEEAGAALAAGLVLGIF